MTTLPLSDIVIYFQDNFNQGQAVSRSALRRFSVMDLDMLVGFGILGSRTDEYFDITYYRLRTIRTKSKGTKMIYSLRVQYAKNWQSRRRAA